jgi:voltage-gated potassium channel
MTTTRASGGTPESVPRLSTAQSPDAAALSALGQIARGLLAQQGGELSWPIAKRGLREALLRDPLDSLAAVVLGGSYLFYLAEKGQNPKVESFWDALTFITTCLSVGYDDVFARTSSGKAIASFVMTFGPALSGAVLEPPAAEKAAEEAEARATQKAILARLDAIHEVLAQRAGPAAG